VGRRICGRGRRRFWIRIRLRICNRPLRSRRPRFRVHKRSPWSRRYRFRIRNRARICKARSLWSRLRRLSRRYRFRIRNRSLWSRLVGFVLYFCVRVRAARLQRDQLLQGLVVRTVYRTFIADQQGDGVSRVGHLLKHPGEATISGQIRELTLDGLLPARDFHVEQGWFPSPRGVAGSNGRSP